MKIKSRVAAVVVGLVTMVAGSLVAATPAQAYPGAIEGCGGGVACVYNGPGFTGPIIHAIAFGFENTTLTGTRRYLNNQSPGWWAYACSSTGGANCPLRFRGINGGTPDTYLDLNFSAIQSIKVDNAP